MALDRRKPKEEQKITRKKDQEKTHVCGKIWEHLQLFLNSPVQVQESSRCSSTKSKATIGKGVLKTSILVLFVDVPVPDPVIVVVL